MLLPLLANVITVDHAKTYKPSPKYYALVEQTLSLVRPEVLFILSNGFDIAAARRFGFTTVWVERAAPAPPKDFERRAEVSPELSAAARRNWCRRRTPAFRRLPDLPKLVATLDR